MFSDIIDKIKEYDSIIIGRHIGVDPDALCSQLALRDSIKLTYPNKEVLAIGTGSNKFTHFGRLDKNKKINNSLIIVLDTPDKRRVDSVDFSLGAFFIKIDHHPFVEKYCDIELVDDSKSSTCEIIIDMIFNSDLVCNDSIAQLLFMGLVSDSNRFLFNSCSSSTFSLVGKLLDHYHVDISSAYEKLYLRPLSEVRLEGFISLNMKVTKNGLGYIVIKNDDIIRFGVDSASAGNMINNFNYIKEVLVWVTISEDIKNKLYRISIRSRGPAINVVAERHNGGGHKMASGVRVDSLDKAMSLINDLDNELSEYNNLEVK